MNVNVWRGKQRSVHLFVLCWWCVSAGFEWCPPAHCDGTAPRVWDRVKGPLRVREELLQRGGVKFLLYSPPPPIAACCGWCVKEWDCGPAGPVTLRSLSGERSTLSCRILVFLWIPHVSVFTDEPDVLPPSGLLLHYFVSYDCSVGKAVKLLKLQLKVQNVCVCVVSSRSNKLRMINYNYYKWVSRPVRLI